MHQSFLQGDTIIIDRHGQVKHSQSNKLATSLHYFKKEVRDGVRFLWKWPDMSKIPKIKIGSW